jgi:pilus assembly protein CpaE
VSTTSVRALLAVDTGLESREVAELFPSDELVHVVGVVDGLDESWRALQDTTVDLLVVACLGYSDRALFLIDGAVKQDPQRPVIVLTQGSPNGFVRRVFQSGAEDILMLPQTREQVRFAVQKVLARRSGGGALTAAGTQLARLVVVLGPKGGTGKTLTAANTAVALAEQGKRVALLDLDLQFGDVALCLGLAPTVTIYDLALAGGTLDADKLEDYLVTHESGVRALLAPSRPDQASAVTIELLRDIYAILRLGYDFVVVDTPPGFTAEVIASIDASTDLIMVGMLDSLSLKNTKLGLETLELMGYNADKIRLILNRAGTRVGISSTDVVGVLGREPDVLIPSDREIPRAVNEGVPIVTSKDQSEAAAGFRKLASMYIDTPLFAPTTGDSQQQAEPRRRLFGRKN